MDLLKSIDDAGDLKGTKETIEKGCGRVDACKWDVSVHAPDIHADEGNC